MSRRVSLAKKAGRKPCKGVHFPADLVFLDNLKENDLDGAAAMLRRASLKIDINAVSKVGLTPLHSAVLDGNLKAVKLLIDNGADVNKKDEDEWTPLHAACAEGFADIASFLLDRGADLDAVNDEGERPQDLIEPTDADTLALVLGRRIRKGHYESQFIDDDDDDDVDQLSSDEIENTNRKTIIDSTTVCSALRQSKR